MKANSPPSLRQLILIIQILNDFIFQRKFFDALRFFVGFNQENLVLDDYGRLILERLENFASDLGCQYLLCQCFFTKTAFNVK